jgi:3',5'-cyclic AMP phosphodiesterase CpdA
MPLSILHISDLHVAGELFSPERGLPRRHDPDLFAALDGYWKAEPADYVVATGDISTDGQVQSLEAARQFLTGAVPRPGASAAIGLGLADPARLFLVPGNHDRYAGRYLPISNQITNFESVFGDRFGNRGRPRAAGWLTSKDLRLRVLAIDSMGAAGWASVAKGKVHDDDLDWLQTVYDDDTRREEPCDLRLLLLHHHVAIPDSHRFNRWTKLKNVADALESMLRADIDLVMFGHEHYHYVGERTYSDLIGDRRVRRRLTKTHQLEKRLITCMCGTTTCDDGGRNLAWRVVIDRQGDRYHLRFVLLEADRTAGTLKPVVGASEDIVLYRRPAWRTRAVV